MPRLRVPKQEVACELLARAIELYLRGDSYYSAIHLAGAAEEVFAVLVREVAAATGVPGKPTIDQMKDAIVALATPATSAEAKAIEDWAHHRMTEAKNSVKHMRGLMDAGAEFDPQEEASDIVDRAISTYIQLANRISLPAVPGILEFDARRRSGSAT